MVPEVSTKPKKIEADLPPIVARDRSARGRIAEWVAMKHLEPTLTNIEIAEKLGITVGTLNTLISRAVRQGWLVFDNPLSRLEHEIVPKALDNLSEFLDKKDRTVTIEVAKGAIFPTYKESRQSTEVPTTILALRIETTNPDASKIVSSSIVGAPKGLPIIDVEVTNAKVDPAPARDPNPSARPAGVLPSAP